MPFHQNTDLEETHSCLNRQVPITHEHSGDRQACNGFLVLGAGKLKLGSATQLWIRLHNQSLELRPNATCVRPMRGAPQHIVWCGPRHAGTLFSSRIWIASVAAGQAPIMVYAPQQKHSIRDGFRIPSSRVTLCAQDEAVGSYTGIPLLDIRQSGSLAYAGGSLAVLAS